MKKKPAKKKKVKKEIKACVLVYPDGSFTTTLNQPGKQIGWISKEINLK